jgi:hypothetical protein
MQQLQNRIDKLRLELGNPHDLMMFSSKARDAMLRNIYIGLPDDGLLDRFPGFKKIDRERLPDFLATLVVREDGFEENFPDIARRRMRK